jgi:hypothetical protein
MQKLHGAATPEPQSFVPAMTPSSSEIVHAATARGVGAIETVPPPPPPPPPPAQERWASFQRCQQLQLAASTPDVVHEPTDAVRAA